MSNSAFLLTWTRQDRFIWGHQSKRLASARLTQLKMTGFIKTLSQFVSFNILLKCHSTICWGPFCLRSSKVNIQKGKLEKGWEGNLTIVLDGEVEEIRSGIFLLPQHVADVQVIDISCNYKSHQVKTTQEDKHRQNRNSKSSAGN